MYKQLSALAGLSLFFCLGTSALAQSQIAPKSVALQSVDVEAAMSAGREGIEFARDLYLDFGSDASLRKIPKSEVKALRLGPAIRHYMIRLDHLQSYEQGAGLNSVLTPLQKVTFPILAPSGPVGQVMTTREDGAWEVHSVGGYRRITNTLAALKYAGNADESGGTARAMVSVPALNMRFLGTSFEGQVYLTRIQSSGLPSEPRPAVAVLGELSERAQRMENLPH